MMTRYEAWLDKKSMSAIDPAIYILDIAYGATRYVTTTSDIPGRNGQKVTDKHARYTSVTITFEIHERDIVRRQEICGRVQAWAMRGGYLTTNDRRGQRLGVICDELPAIDSALKWTKALRVTFGAYEQPFWEDEYPRIVSIIGAETSESLYAPGFGALARVEADVRNTSSKVIDALTLKAGGTTFDFSGLGLEAGRTLEIKYDERGLLVIRDGNGSRMGRRTAESNDDLMVQTGKMATVSVRADGEVSAVFRTRGLYL